MSLSNPPASDLPNFVIASSVCGSASFFERMSRTLSMTGRNPIASAFCASSVTSRRMFSESR
jgi:hypothetical protein